MNAEERMIIRKALEREQKLYLEADRTMADNKVLFLYCAGVIANLERELGIDRA